MLQELVNVNEQYISYMKKQQCVLGSWYIGSISHETTDDYSDIDISFLIEDSEFESIGQKSLDFMSSIVDDVIICWAENFNNKKIKSYSFILKLKCHIFQYDVVLINKNYTDYHMCKIFYMNLQNEHIIFDKQEYVKELVLNAPLGSFYSMDRKRIIETYWFYVEMSIKYFKRKDFFKLEGVMRVLFDMHSSLILTGYDKINWGGTENKLHFIDSRKQKHLMKYGCIEDLSCMRNNLLQSICWFEEDVEDIGTVENQKYSHTIGELIKEHWIKHTQ